VAEHHGVEDDIEATNYLMNEGYRSRNFNLTKKPKKKKKEEYKVCDFVDALKAIEGSTSEEEEKVPRSKAARDEMESINPNEPVKVRSARLAREDRLNKRAKADKRSAALAAAKGEVIKEDDDDDQIPVTKTRRPASSK